MRQEILSYRWEPNDGRYVSAGELLGSIKDGAVSTNGDHERDALLELLIFAVINLYHAFRDLGIWLRILSDPLMQFCFQVAFDPSLPAHEPTYILRELGRRAYLIIWMSCEYTSSSQGLVIIRIRGCSMWGKGLAVQRSKSCFFMQLKSIENWKSENTWCLIWWAGSRLWGRGAGFKCKDWLNCRLKQGGACLSLDL